MLSKENSRGYEGAGGKVAREDELRDEGVAEGVADGGESGCVGEVGEEGCVDVLLEEAVVE